MSVQKRTHRTNTSDLKMLSSPTTAKQTKWTPKDWTPKSWTQRSWTPESWMQRWWTRTRKIIANFQTKKSRLRFHLGIKRWSVATMTWGSQTKIDLHQCNITTIQSRDQAKRAWKWVQSSNNRHDQQLQPNPTTTSKKHHNRQLNSTTTIIGTSKKLQDQQLQLNPTTTSKKHQNRQQNPTTTIIGTSKKLQDHQLQLNPTTTVGTRWAIFRWVKISSNGASTRSWDALGCWRYLRAEWTSSEIRKWTDRCWWASTKRFSSPTSTWHCSRRKSWWNSWEKVGDRTLQCMRNYRRDVQHILLKFRWHVLRIKPTGPSQRPKFTPDWLKLKIEVCLVLFDLLCRVFFINIFCL